MWSKSPKNLIIIFFSCLLLCLSAGLVLAADEEKVVSMDFDKVELSTLIKFISELTGKNFIVDPRVAGQVTVYSPTALSVDEAYQVFLSILEVNKFRLIEAGNAYQIVPDAEARFTATETTDQTLDLPPAQLITRVINVQKSSATELAKLLPQLLGEQGLVSVYTPGNTLIVTTTAALMGKVLAVVAEVDQSRYVPELRTFTLEHAGASASAEKITRMLAERLKRGETYGQNYFAVIEGDDRTGTLVAIADPESQALIKELLNTIDQPTLAGRGDMQVIPLQYASAEDLATILTSLISGSTSADPNANTSTVATSGENTQTVAPKANKVFMDNVNIVADKATNSLLVVASASDFDTVLSLVRELDIERRQVYVEALIVEVSTEAMRNVGVNWYAAGASGAGLVMGGVNTGGNPIGFTGTNPSLLTLPTGGSVGFMSKVIEFAGIKFPNIFVLANFLRTDSNFKILSTPQLMTLDNEEATVTVADNIPFLTQSSTGNTTTDRIVQNVDYRDVGVTLKILPQVSANGSVKLKINQIVSRVVNTGVVSGGQALLAPTTKRREVNTTVVVEDGETIVIAGLIGQDSQGTTTKVPGLGDIPLAGWLFKNNKEENADTNLLLFLTPKVVLNKSDALKIEVEKRRALHRIETGLRGNVGMARIPVLLPKPSLAALTNDNKD